MAARKTMEEVRTALNELADQAKSMEVLGKSLPEDTNKMLGNLEIEKLLGGLLQVRIIEIMADYFGVDPNNIHLIKG